MQRALLLVLTLIIAGPAGAADEFYTVRLRAGEEAYRAKRYTEAAENLRVACFGLLDQPVYYSEALVGLALAQAGSNNVIEADATLARFVEVERLFNVYPKVKLDPAVRTEFESLAARRINPDSLAALPSLSRLIETREQKVARMSPAERRKAIEELVRTEPRNVTWPLALAREEAAQSDWKGVIKWTDAALIADEKDVEARALRAHARTLRRDHADALADLLLLPAARVNADAVLTADLFVCRVAGHEWDAARPLLPRLDESNRGRPDVKAALKKLPAEKTPVEPAIADAKPAPPATNATPAFTSSASPKAIVTPTPVPNAPHSPAPKPAQTSRSVISEADMIAMARRLCAAGKPDEAVQLLKNGASGAAPTRAFRKALLEATCLSKDWKAASVLAAQVEPFQIGEETFVFYAAIALFETGSVDRARSLLSGSRSRIASSPYVDYYSKRILGTP